MEPLTVFAGRGRKAKVVILLTNPPRILLLERKMHRLSANDDLGRVMRHGGCTLHSPKGRYFSTCRSVKSALLDDLKQGIGIDQRTVISYLDM